MKTSPTTTPLKKFILTAEFWLVAAFNAALGIAAIFGSLPGVQAIKYAAIVNAVTMFARQGLKAIASLNPALGLQNPTNLPTGAMSSEGIVGDSQEYGSTPPDSNSGTSSAAPVA